MVEGAGVSRAAAQQRDVKLARIDRELATIAARQAQLLNERASVIEATSESLPAEPEIGPVSDIAQARAKQALQNIRTGRRVRP